jgi:2'-5' RNA ligase
VPPFRADEAQLEHLCRQLKTIAKKASKFELKVRGYGAFKPRVIYLDVPEKQEAMVLRQKLLSLLMPEMRGKKAKLHITLAARDMNIEMFLKAWEANIDQPFKASFVVDSVHLLKHDGAKWQFYQEFKFKGDTMQVRK